MVVQEIGRDVYNHGYDSGEFSKDVAVRSLGELIFRLPGLSPPNQRQRSASRQPCLGPIRILIGAILYSSRTIASIPQVTTVELLSKDGCQISSIGEVPGPGYSHDACLAYTLIDTEEIGPAIGNTANKLNPRTL